MRIIHEKLLRKFRKRRSPKVFFEEKLVESIFFKDQIQIRKLLTLASQRPLLEDVLTHARLSFLERKTLESFLKHTRLLQRRDENRLKNIQLQLEEKSFFVLPVPGIYMDTEYTINYMNALAGQGNTGSFIATNSFKGIPGESYLRDAYTLFLQAGGIDSVYFYGNTFDGILETRRNIDSEFHENMSLRGSFHCRTLES